MDLVEVVNGEEKQWQETDAAIDEFTTSLFTQSSNSRGHLGFGGKKIDKMQLLLMKKLRLKIGVMDRRRVERDKDKIGIPETQVNLMLRIR